MLRAGLCKYVGALGLGHLGRDDEVGKQGHQDDEHENNETEEGDLVFAETVPDLPGNRGLFDLFLFLGNCLSHGDVLLSGTWP